MISLGPGLRPAGAPRPPLLAAACAALGAAPPDGPTLRKAGFWVLHSAGGALVAAEQHATE